MTPNARPLSSLSSLLLTTLRVSLRLIVICYFDDQNIVERWVLCGSLRTAGSRHVQLAWEGTWLKRSRGSHALPEHGPDSQRLIWDPVEPCWQKMKCNRDVSDVGSSIEMMILVILVQIFSRFSVVRILPKLSCWRHRE